jgi:hypothetical protein
VVLAAVVSKVDKLNFELNIGNYFNNKINLKH